MGKTYVKKVMSPEQLLSEYPLPEAHKQLKAQRDEEIKKVFTGESDKFLVIIGPCSADNEDSVCDYIGRLARFRIKLRIRSLSFQESIPTSLVLPGRVIKESFISRIRKKHPILLKV